MRTKGKQAHRMIRVPVTDPSVLSLCEDCGEPWCWRHMDHFKHCPCITPTEATEQGFTLVKIDGQDVGEKRVEK